jgi:hypothetical protein
MQTVGVPAPMESMSRWITWHADRGHPWIPWVPVETVGTHEFLECTRIPYGRHPWNPRVSIESMGTRGFRGCPWNLNGWGFPRGPPEPPFQCKVWDMIWAVRYQPEQAHQDPIHEQVWLQDTMTGTCAAENRTLVDNMCFWRCWFWSCLLSSQWLQKIAQTFAIDSLLTT